MGTGETVAVKQVKLADLPKSELRVITVWLQNLEILSVAADRRAFSLKSIFLRILMYVRTP